MKYKVYIIEDIEYTKKAYMIHGDLFNLSHIISHYNPIIHDTINNNHKKYATSIYVNISVNEYNWKMLLDIDMIGAQE